MRILLCNDDGILAPGLAALYAAVADLGEVTVVAPSGPRSATGHGITLEQPLTVQRVQVGRPGSPDSFAGISVDGSPADCVRLAILRLMDGRPDLVLAGLNAGANVGINVFYSGTVAAAAEGVMLGIPAVAFSACASGTPVDFPRAARLCRWVLDGLLKCELTHRDLINVNIPELRPSLPQGLRVCAQSTAGVIDRYHDHSHPNGQEAYKIGTEFAFTDPHADSDVACLEAGFVTVTPLHVDMTRHERLPGLAACQWPDMPE